MPGPLRITTPYFDLGFKIIGVPLLGVLAGYLVFGAYYLWVIPVVLLMVVSLTTFYVTEVDLEKKCYRDYLSLFFVPVSVERGNFSRLYNIVVTKQNLSQTLNTRAQTRTMKWTSFTGTLVMDGNKTLELLSKTDKTDLINGLLPMAQALNIPIEDQTSARHYVIDPTTINS